jgi:hypothetical protein
MGPENKQYLQISESRRKFVGACKERTHHENDPIDCHFPYNHRKEGSRKVTGNILEG